MAVCHPGVRLGPPPAEPPAVPRVLCLTAIERWKAPDQVLEAVALAAPRLEGLTLTLAGTPIGADGERLWAELVARASRPDLAGRVDLVGRVDDPMAQLDRHACLIHLAPREPFGRIFAEALARGRPVVAVDDAGPGEIVDATCGRLVAPGDVAGASEALVELLGDRDVAQRAGEAARRRAEARFDVHEQAAAFAVLATGEAPERGGGEGPLGSVPAGTGMALVTVTHDSAAVIETLLASVDRHLPGARTIVVDAASRDDGPQRARAAGAEVLELGTNPGFGAATNRGVEHVDEPLCCLINPDVELTDASLAEAAATLGPGDRRILAPRLLSYDGRAQNSAHLRPAHPLALAYALVPPALAPGPLRRALEPWRDRRPRPVGWAVAACLIAPTALLRELGPFDERLFLYAEDLDLGLRAQAVGIETTWWPHARVLHRDAHSTAAAFGSEPLELLARQRRTVVGRRLGRAARTLDDVAQALTFADRWVVKRALGLPAGREAAQLEALREARRGR